MTQQLLSTLTLTVLTLLTLAPPRAALGLGIRLQRHSHTAEQEERYFRAIHQHHAALLQGSQSDSAEGREIDIRVGDVDRTLFTAQVSFGSPPQPFALTLDTGSTQLWVATTACTSAVCESHPLFDPEASSTYETLPGGFEVEFGTGKIEGNMGQDAVGFGGVLVPKQVFGAVDTQEGDVFQSRQWSGILGLGFPALSPYPDRTPLFDNILKTGQLDSNSFSFFLTRDAQESMFFLGKPRPGYFEGDLDWIPVTEQYYWSLPLEDILVDGRSLGLCPGGKCVAVADSGTTFMSAPSSDLPVIMRALFDSEQDMLRKCTQRAPTATITYVLDGKNYTLGAGRLLGELLHVQRQLLPQSKVHGTGRGPPARAAPHPGRGLLHQLLHGL